MLREIDSCTALWYPGNMLPDTGTQTIKQYGKLLKFIYFCCLVKTNQLSKKVKINNCGHQEHLNVLVTQ